MRKKIPYKIWVEIFSVLIAATGLLWAIITSAHEWASSGIREIIIDEAAAVMQLNTQKAVSLYMPDNESEIAVINDQYNNTIYFGIPEITARYQRLPVFKKLVHVNVEIEEIRFLAGHALAHSSTKAIFNKDGQLYQIANINGDSWEFVRVNRIPFLPWTGQWKIKSFSSK